VCVIIHIISELYLGAPVEVLQNVLINGFDMDLWPPRNDAYKSLEVFGEGMYLTRHASKAHHFSGKSGFVLLIAAHLVKSTATVVPGRQLPTATPPAEAAGPAHYKTSSRDVLAAGAHGWSEEVLVFKERLPPLLPLCIVEYAPI